jgi:23S rRNA (adenine2503-C2)-methyltransferase
MSVPKSVPKSVLKSVLGQTPGATNPAENLIVQQRFETPVDGKLDILGLSKDELKVVLAEAGVAAKQVNMRATQVWGWVYHKGVTDFDDMKNINKDVKAILKAKLRISRPEITEAQYSTDGTRKYLIKFADGNEAEAVYIPEDDRGTLCISSQVGCTLSCKFCHTGTQKLVRNLTANEIVAQMMIARDDLEEWPSSSHNRKVTNIVMMGMGEPLYNFDNVKKALKIIMDEEGIQMSKRRITLSTSGVVPMMERAGEEIGVNLAVSLHATNDKTRTEIMPINNKYNLDQLLTACANYPGVHNARRVTFEYAMLKDINDSDEQARELVRLIQKYNIPAKVNLIPFNPWPGTPYVCSDNDQIKKFSDIIFAAGYSAPIRKPRGQDIMAACGQLKSSSEKRKKADILREEKTVAKKVAP